jgi:hypothetical protein
MLLAGWDPDFLWMVPAIVVARIVIDRLDRQRIREYVRQHGGVVVSISWAPFGEGWFGSRNERVYHVRYRTAEGKTTSATCKTGLWSGVYWTGESIPN